MSVALINLAGYIIFRKAESQRCEAAKDPKSGAIKLMEASQGLWNYVRHPNYLGEILIQWSWVLPAGNFNDFYFSTALAYQPSLTQLFSLCSSIHISFITFLVIYIFLHFFNLLIKCFTLIKKIIILYSISLTLSYHMHMLTIV